ncbi:histidine kinase [Burkholderiaceae bacterium 16]|nr:histidine kinase [Burkholderiaceae bacterium 16]
MSKLLRFSALNLALGYVAVSLVALALFATPLWYAWRNTIEQSRTEVLQAEAQNMMDLFAKHGAAALVAAIETRVGGQLEDVENTIILFADPTWAKRAGNLPAWPREVSASTGTQVASIDVGGRVVRAVLLHQTLPGGYHLLLGRDVSRFEKLETLFLYGLVGAASIVLLLGVAGGALIRRTILSKVHDINQTACAIMQGNLTHRLPAYGGENELNTLVETENRMLDQIEHLFEGIRNVSNAIAHDLRTPLAELRYRLEELSVTRPRLEQTFAEIEGAIADVDRVIAIFNALLRLAEIDSGTRRSGFIEVDATTVAGEAAEFYQPVAELKGVALSFASSGPLTLAGDPLLLAQAVGNLIDNALKYAQEHGRVTVEASSRPDGAIVIAVSDDGPGIPDEEKPKVLERFYRGDASRSTPGVGLGLSLVAAVAKQHGGVLELTDNHPGLRATLILFS